MVLMAMNIWEVTPCSLAENNPTFWRHVVLPGKRCRNSKLSIRHEGVEMETGLRAFLNLGSYWRLSGQQHGSPSLNKLYQGANWRGEWVGPGAGLGGRGKSRPTRIRFPDRLASRYSYRLSHHGPESVL
jgi:hypothetical protein